MVGRTRGKIPELPVLTSDRKQKTQQLKRHAAGCIFKQKVRRSGSASWASTDGTRGCFDRHPAQVFANGSASSTSETHLTHRLYELTFQQFVDQRFWLAKLVSYTYWNSEFTVLGIALLWVYFRRHDAFIRFRNTILLANVLGLVGYVFLPTAPPRLMDLGFVNHSDGLLPAANPYAAMRVPSLHAADALIVGVFLASLTRHWWAKAFWIAWPA